MTTGRSAGHIRLAQTGTYRAGFDQYGLASTTKQFSAQIVAGKPNTTYDAYQHRLAMHDDDIWLHLRRVT